MNDEWYFSGRNDYLINHKVNVTFETLHHMSEEEFDSWLIELQDTVKYAWDELGLPPDIGKSYHEIVEDFRKLSTFPVKDKFELPGGIINNKHTNLATSSVNRWFPNRAKTPISRGDNSKALSVYSGFADRDFLPTLRRYLHRNLKRDSFYHYSQPIYRGQEVKINGEIHIVKSARDFLDWFDNNHKNSKWSYWLKKVDGDKTYTGYNEELTKKEFVTYIPCENDQFQVMLYEKGQKIFPLGFKAFRITWAQIPANFPPMTAKYLYEKYTEHCKNQDEIIVYDPSMGWGGRIIGAMAVRTDRNIRYLGTDPNKDNLIKDSDESKYSNVADFYNKVKNSGTIFKHNNQYEIWHLGSEVISEDKRFAKYKGNVDFAFTSPPYFSKEVYSTDPEQSCHKFPQYQEWVDGFLKPTLKTIYDWLKPNRYCAWNIADAKFHGELLPLENDSIKIALKLGFRHVDTLKMLLANMPGGNRMNWQEGESTAKNIVMVDGKPNRYEPIFIFFKP